ncbi:MAG: hypothetical protein CVU52_07270 [Deltaproteobacteria bacterium HGW-Deltaproteobacteria-10]|nr:MAG: hypothetical protein CVU52_07270 [Deltaproteobacteria bacterium HGW-Deltaproteobacteria-10]
MFPLIIIGYVFKCGYLSIPVLTGSREYLFHKIYLLKTLPAESNKNVFSHINAPKKAEEGFF